MAAYSSTIAENDMAAAMVGARQAAFSMRMDTGEIQWSPNAADALDWPELTRTHTVSEMRARLRDEDCAARDRWLKDASLRGIFHGEYRMVRPGGSVLWLEERLTRLDARDGRPLTVVGMLRNVTEHKEREARLAYMANYDQLTGHLNRSRLREVLALAMAGALTEGTPVGFQVIAVDNMQGINDAYGYDIADELIVRVGARLERMLGPHDSIGRISGSKFGLICPGLDAAGLEARANSIRDAVRETVVVTHAGPVAVTVSIGGVTLPDSARTTHDAISAAEEALNAACAQSPDSYLAYRLNDEHLAIRRRNITIAEEIVAALSEDRLSLAYQPVVRSDNPSIVAFHECLARMRDVDGELVPAGHFMPVAEKLGLVRLLDRRVLELSFETLRTARSVRLSINLSPQSAQDPLWLDSFLDLAEGNRDVTERLIIEVTESAAIYDAERTARVINRLRDLGCAFALDDFGAGYTSFRHFKHLKMDMVKIDGSFIRGVCSSPDNQVFVRTLVDLARNFDMMTVAEMVSDDEEAALLRDLGIDCFQGFHFGRPAMAPDWLTRESAPIAIAGE